MEKKITLPMSREVARSLKAGDLLLLSGILYTARDAAHKRLTDMMKNGEALPFDLEDATVYFVGPCPEKPGEVIGSAGPTTSYRMDAYSPMLIEAGLTGMIGKGMRNAAVVEAMKAHGAVYLGAIGGAAALIAGKITSQEIVAFPELGPEAVRKLTVEDFPVTVIIDAEGHNFYQEGRAAWQEDPWAPV